MDLSKNIGGEGGMPVRGIDFLLFEAQYKDDDNAVRYVEACIEMADLMIENYQKSGQTSRLQRAAEMAIKLRDLHTIMMREWDKSFPSGVVAAW